MGEHVTAKSTYYWVYGALIALTALTTWVATLDLGALGMPVALAIAVGKAMLVTLFFMHVLYSTRLTKLVVVGGLFWVGILFVLTFTDYLTRAFLTYG